MNTSVTSIASRIVTGLAGCIVATTVFAQSVNPVTAGQPMAEKVNESGVKTVCGGVGSDEATQIKQMARDYDMALTFATQSGSFLADVAVTVSDAKGVRVLETSCGAPMLLVALPKPGNYKIVAQASGQTLTRMSTVTAKRQSKAITLLWPRQAAANSETITPRAIESGR